MTLATVPVTPIESCQKKILAEAFEFFRFTTRKSVMAVELFERCNFDAQKKARAGIAVWALIDLGIFETLKDRNTYNPELRFTASVQAAIDDGRDLDTIATRARKQAEAAAAVKSQIEQEPPAPIRGLFGGGH